jgi:hypothetical protein
LVVIARLDRAIQYAAASRQKSAVSGILGRPVKPDDDSGAKRRGLLFISILVLEPTTASYSRQSREIISS